MRSRVNGTIDPHNYQARGIGIDPAWDDYAVFLSDMGECPEGHSIDRIDNDGSYGPGNCRWADRATQSRNNRRNRWIELHGEKMVVKDAARRLGITDSAIINAVKRLGLTYQQAIDRVVNGVRANERDVHGRYVGFSQQSSS